MDGRKGLEGMDGGRRMVSWEKQGVNEEHHTPQGHNMSKSTNHMLLSYDLCMRGCSSRCSLGVML